MTVPLSWRRSALLGALSLMTLMVAADRVRASLAGVPASSPPPVERNQRGEASPELRSLAAGDLVIPVAGVRREDLRGDFGAPRGGNRTHQAIDILAPRGTEVLAAVDGTIEKLYTSDAGGLTLYLFDQKRERNYYYAHLDAYAEGLREDQRVTRGEVIGYVGTTGNAPTGAPHLHFAIETVPPTGEWWKGEPTDPYPLLRSRGVTVPE
ncbi:MAG TPA: M23 family metallopeptidase [Thermoanaerobaculia bacterium]|nr:M23 family metallopeptidase [Thermoanaerobaculia bacterium]